MSNSLDQDQARRFVGPDLGPNCLQKNQQTTQGDKEFMCPTGNTCHARGELSSEILLIIEVLQLASKNVSKLIFLQFFLFHIYIITDENKQHNHTQVINLNCLKNIAGIFSTLVHLNRNNPYQLDKSISNFMVAWWYFSFLLKF